MRVASYMSGFIQSASILAEQANTSPLYACETYDITGREPDRRLWWETLSLCALLGLDPPWDHALLDARSFVYVWFHPISEYMPVKPTI
jgi:hypothetical protein